MIPTNVLPTKTVREFWDYCDGHLYWKKKPGRKIRLGKQAGSIQTKGYHAVCFWYKLYRTHNLIWLWHERELPEGKKIRHRNGIMHDNRIENLELF